MNGKERATSAKKTRRYQLIAVGATAAMLLAGCSGGNSGDKGGDTESGINGKGAVKGTIEMSWWGSGERNTKTNAVADQFVAKHPKVTIKRSSSDFDAYWTKLNVQAAGKSMPCVTQMQARQLNDYTKNNLLLPLEPMIKSGVIDVSQIPKTLLDTGRGTDGKLYMIPTGAAYDDITINTTLADQAGVGLPDEGYDWQDYTDWLMAAKDSLPQGTYASNLLGGKTPDIFIGYVAGNNGGKPMFDKEGKINFSKQLLTDYWTMWEKLRKAGATVPAAMSADEPTTTQARFISTGKLMSDTAPGNQLEAIQDALSGAAAGLKVTSMLFPSGPAGPGNIIITSGFSIPKTCGNVPTAASFIDFFTNDPQAGKTFASDNGAATNTDVLDAQIKDPNTSELLKHELELFEKMTADPKTEAIVYPSGYQQTFATDFTREYEDISFGKKSIKEAVDDFFAEANTGS